MKRIYECEFDDNSDTLLVEAKSFDHAYQKAKSELKKRNDQEQRYAKKHPEDGDATVVELDRITFKHSFK
jgi:hypothetical protein